MLFKVILKKHWAELESLKEMMEKYYQGLMTELRVLKIKTSIKKNIMIILSLLIAKLEVENEAVLTDHKNTLLRSLDSSLSSTNPQIHLIIGSFKGLRYCLNWLHPSESEMENLIINFLEIP